MIIEGTISVKSAVINHKRKVNSITVNADKYSKDINYIVAKAHEARIEVIKENSNFFLNYPKAGGIIADVFYRDYDLELNKDLIMVVDGVEDPFNLGYIFRNGACYDADFLINDRAYNESESVILKSSAGAFDLLNIKASKDLYQDLKSLKEKGYQIIALNRVAQSKEIFDIDLQDKIVVILGGEKRGYAKKLNELCDDFMHISYDTDFRNAMNATSASGIALNMLSLKRKGRI